jgi:hypothetical protein
MGRARGGCERRRWEASPLATHRVRSDRVSVRERLRQAERGNEGSGWHSATRGGVLIGVSGPVVGRATIGPCGPLCFTGQTDSRPGPCRPTGYSSGPSTAHSA